MEKNKIIDILQSDEHIPISLLIVFYNSEFRIFMRKKDIDRAEEYYNDINKRIVDIRQESEKWKK